MKRETIFYIWKEHENRFKFSIRFFTVPLFSRHFKIEIKFMKRRLYYGIIWKFE